mmetsp:Transcript_10908/g.19920  ORF Transcript_10908/g.19920 Transcript_10908/m.19920 type:complete len:292 (+) Transcript_10908:1083-1958(+)
MAEDQQLLRPIPTHRVCVGCDESLPRHLFSKKEYRKEKNPECHICRRTITAERCKQAPPQKTILGRVADSGVVRRPNNFGYCNYIDMLFSMRCFGDIVALGAFASAKDVSESMSAIHAATKHSDVLDLKGSDVMCVCIGDGSTPRTAVLASFLKGWTCLSIDPALSEEWRGDCPKNVAGLMGFGGTLEEFITSLPTTTESSFTHLILLCVHSHARFVGSATIEHIREKYANIPTTLVSLPCCAKFRHVGDIGHKPDAQYEDDCVFSACRRVEIWNFCGKKKEPVICSQTWP